MNKGFYTNRMAEVPLQRARHIACQFNVPEPVDVFEFSGKGNINRQAFLVVAGPEGNRTEHILQLLNAEVFTTPQIVMDTMVSCIQAQQEALSRGTLREDEEWEPIRLIPTKEGRSYLEMSTAAGSEFWRMMLRIGHARSYANLREIANPVVRLHVAEEAGRGLALFGALTEAMDASAIGCPLPGYRDTQIYYDQLASVLAGNRTLQDAAALLPSDPVLRQSTEQHFLLHIGPAEYQSRSEDSQLGRFIALALEQKPFALRLFDELISGKLKRVVVHGDTKLDNFLFSTRTGKVKALVDLDTIMPHTWLSDWGDLARSLVNIAGEREPESKKIEVDLEIFKALARGFLGSARKIGRHEMDLMVEAAQVMALELGVRFLADYLRGDSYFKLMPAEPWDLNKTRAMVQFSVFERLREKAEEAKQYIEELSRSHSRT